VGESALELQDRWKDAARGGTEIARRFWADEEFIPIIIAGVGEL